MTSSGITATRCRECGRQFPPRVWCSGCGSSSLDDVTVRDGEVTEATVLRRMVGGELDEPVRIGSVRLEGGGMAIARLEQGSGTGDRVVLSDDDGAPVARPG